MAVPFRIDVKHPGGRRHRSGAFSYALCDALCAYGGVTLFGFHQALGTWLDEPPGSLEELCARLGLDPDEFWRQAGRLYECGLLDIAREGEGLRFELKSHWEYEGELRRVRSFPGREVFLPPEREVAATAEREEFRPDHPVLAEFPVYTRFLRLSSEEQVAEVSRRFEEEFAGPAGQLTQTECEKIVDWLDQWEPLMLFMALEEAVHHNARSFRYIDRVLLNWSKGKVRTPVDVIQRRRERDGKEDERGGKPKGSLRRRAARLGQRPEERDWEGDEELW